MTIRLALFPFFTVFIYLLSDIFFTRGSIQTQVSLALIYASLFFVLLYGLARPYKAQKNFRADVTLFWSLLVIIFATIPILFQQEKLWKDIIGDIGVFLLLPISLFYFRVFKVDTKVLLTLGFGILCSTFFLPLGGPEIFNENGRFPPPHPVAIIVSIALAFSLKKSNRYLAVLLVPLVISIAYFSGQRTAFLTFIIIALLSMLLSRKGGFFLFILAVLLISSQSFLSIDRLAELIPSVADSRIFKILSRGGLFLDASLEGRILEVKDIIYQMKYKSSLFDLIFGHGHGAHFEPRYIIGQRTRTQIGTIHHAHFSPAVILYRYGFVGLCGYLGLWYCSISAFVKLYTQRGSRDLTGVFITLSMLSILINSLVFSITNKPVDIFFIAAFLALNFNVKRYANSESLHHQNIRGDIALQQ